MKTCEDLRTYLAAYADGELEGDLCEQVRAHLDTCEGCDAECADLKKVAELYREAPLPEVSEADWARVSAALERCMAEPTPATETVRERPRVLAWLWPSVAVAAAAVLGMVWVNWGMFFGGTPGTGNGAVVKNPVETVMVASVDSLEVSDAYEFIMRPVVAEDDVLVIDIYNAE